MANDHKCVCVYMKRIANELKCSDSDCSSTGYSLYSPFTFRKSLTQNLLAFQLSIRVIIYTYNVWASDRERVIAPVSHLNVRHFIVSTDGMLRHFCCSLQICSSFHSISIQFAEVTIFILTSVEICWRISFCWSLASGNNWLAIIITIDGILIEFMFLVCV